MEPNPERRINQQDSLTPMQKIIREMEAERAARRSEKWNPKDIAIAVLAGILGTLTIINLAEGISNLPK